MVRAPSIRFRIDFAENLNLGPGKIALLEAIGSHGSSTTAAASLGLSYRRAWLLLDSLNKTFAEITAIGGRHLKEILPHLASESAATHRFVAKLFLGQRAVRRSRALRR
jgi:molybdenum-dependent DNA-binding transcriptional regulator ModE